MGGVFWLDRERFLDVDLRRLWGLMYEETGIPLSFAAAKKKAMHLRTVAPEAPGF